VSKSLLTGTLSDSVKRLLRCPICAGKLAVAQDGLQCQSERCRASFPLIEDIPILINTNSSVFSIDDFVAKRKTYFDPARRPSAWKDALGRLLYGGGIDFNQTRMTRQFSQHLVSLRESSRVLVLGGGVLSNAMSVLTSNRSIEFIESDVSLGPRTMLVCDAHDIPFEDGSFDAVIAESVLEHVADPYRCVSEVFRVLRAGGIVYAETPFIQQVHGAQFDFTRFTHLGHRRLFRDFDEIDSGIGGGPGYALAWSYKYFLLSFTSVKPLRKLIRIFANLTSFYLKYFDYFLMDKPGSLDAASSYYFLGKKCGRTLSDHELIRSYRGAGW